MIDEYVPYRIQRIYSSSTEKERYYLKKILEEISETGDSQTYRDIWLSDYVEIPVDIDTFLRDDLYLGKTNRNGEAVYPFWQDFMRKLFYAGNKYEEVFFTGATRIGKSSTAITCTSYMLYKLMCLRDPQQYFGKKDVSVFSILFFNLTKELAAGVGYREFQDTVLASPWFLDHGSRMGSDKNPYYVPDGGKVVIDFGSDSAHSLGKQVFCLVGSTKVITSEGEVTLSELNGTNPDILTCTHEGTSLATNSGVILTKYVKDTIRIELEDGTVIEGTPDHRVLLSNGQYKQLSDLSEDDDLMEVEVWKDVTGYEGYYEVSSFGRVRSVERDVLQHMKYCDRVYHIRPRYLTQYRASYPYVTLHKNSVTCDYYVPYLVIHSFLGMDVSVDGFYHVDRDTTNNHLSNLRIGRRPLGEGWSPVPDTNGLLEVSSSGSLYVHSFTYKGGKNFDRIFVNVEHLVDQHEDNDGYLYFELTCFPQFHFVHRVVAKTFVPNPDPKNKDQVNHKDGDKHNNCVENLEWVTSKENIDHAFANHLRTHERDIELCYRMSKLNCKPVKCVNNGAVFDSIKEASKFAGVSDEGLRLSILENRPMKSGLKFVLV